MGSGMATIRDPNPIKLGEFHTVELFRNLTLGYIAVDGGEPINGSSQVLQAAPMSRHVMRNLQQFSDSHGGCSSSVTPAGQVPGPGSERGAACGRLP